MRDAVLIRYEIGHRWSTCELWLGIETILSGEEGGCRLFRAVKSETACVSPLFVRCWPPVKRREGLSAEKA